MERLAEYTLIHLCFINLTKAYDSVDQLPWWEIYLCLVAVNILSLVAMSFLSWGASVLKNAILQWHCIGLQPLLKINNGTLKKALAWPLHCPMMGATVYRTPKNIFQPLKQSWNALRQPGCLNGSLWAGGNWINNISDPCLKCLTIICNRNMFQYIGNRQRNQQKIGGLDWIGNLIYPGEAFGHEATFQGTQNYNTDKHSIHTHTYTTHITVKSACKSVSSVDGRGVPLFPTAPGGEPLPSHFFWSSIVTCASRPPASPALRNVCLYGSR